MTPTAVAAPATLTAAYEHLRAWVAGQEPPGPRPTGLALVFRRGLPGWLAAATTWLPTAARSPLSPPMGSAGCPAAAPAGELAHVLAAMVAACQQEVSR